MTDTLFHTLLTITWQSAMLAAVVYVVIALFGRRLHARFRYLLWCIVLLRLMLPILPTMPWTYPQVDIVQMKSLTEPQSLDCGEHVAQSEDRGERVTQSEDCGSANVYQNDEILSHNFVPFSMSSDLPIPSVAHEPSAASGAERNFRVLPHAALAVWLLGIVILGFRYVRDEFRLYHRSRYWKQVDDPSIIALLERCRRELGIRRRVKLLAVPTGIGAAAAGLFHPKILLSEQAMAIAPERLRMVFLHELIHIKRFDPMMLRLTTILTLIHWFNPAAWLAAFQLQRERELACDAAVLDRLGDSHRKEYGDAVLTFAKLFSVQERLPGLAGALQHYSQNNSIIRRINMIKNYRRSRYFHALLGGLLVLAVAGFGLTKAQQNQSALPQSPPHEQVSEDTLLLRGKVFDAGEPVANAVVRIIGGTAEQDQETTTNENGEFTLKKPMGYGEMFGLIYATDATRTKIGNTRWFFNTEIQEFYIALSLEPAARVITGTVVDAEGKPAEGILVAGSHQIVRSEPVRTDKDGKFQFLFPEDASLLRLIAYKKGFGFDIYATEEIDPYQPAGDTAITPLESISNGPFHLTLAPIEPVKIRVLAEDGTPLAGVRVSPWLIQKPGKLPKPETVMWGSPYHKEQMGNQFNTAGFSLFDSVTGEDGIATLESVPKTFLDESTFIANGPSGFGTATSQWKEIEIKDGLPTLTLPRQGSILGTIKLEDGTPVSGVQIGVRWHNGSGGGAITDDKGEFRLHDNAHVIYNLSFESDKGAAPSVFNISVGDGSEEKRLDIVLKPGIRLHGKVFLPDGSPAENFVITVNEKDPNPPASFDRYSVDWEAHRDGTVYTNDQADKQVYPPRYFRQFLHTEKEEDWQPGEYETLLPAVPREYSFRAVRYASRENPQEISAYVETLRLLGTESEVKLDFYLSERGDITCTPLATIASTPTGETAKPVAPGEQSPWVGASDDPKSDNAMIPLDAFIKVLDAEVKPMKDVEIEVRYAGGEQGNFKVKTDENGIASVKELETKNNTSFVNYSIKQSGYVFRMADWYRGSSQWADLPKEYVFTMEKGIEVGGIVVDENSQPIQGATVNCGYDAPDRNNHLYPAGEATTDADGKWSVNMAPASIQRFRLDVTHPDYVRSELTGTYPPYSQMRDKTAVVMLRKGVSLTGTVRGPDGLPIKDAKVVITEKRHEFSGVQPQKTKEEGTFRFDNWKPGLTTVYVAAVGFAPQTQEVSDFSQPIEFKLEPGKTIRFTVLDLEGKPIPQARVAPFRWRGTFLLLGDRDLIPQYVDDEGNWSWTWAPDDEVDYSIIREGYQTIRDLNLAARDEPYVYRMRLPLEIRGRVTDAESGEAIRNIVLISGGNFDGKNPQQASYWNEDNPSRFTDGNYRALFTEPRDGGGHHFRIEAEGYTPFVSEMFTDDQGSLELDVKLNRTR